MDIVKFFLDEKYGGYSYKNASNIEMCTLGNFLSSEIGCGYPSSFKEWGVNDNWGDETLVSNPLPNWPNKLFPHAHTLPSFLATIYGHCFSPTTAIALRPATGS